MVNDRFVPFRGIVFGTGTFSESILLAIKHKVTAQTFPYSDPASWSLALTISPGWTLPFVTLAYLLALIIIAAIIGGLHYREVYLDQQEKKKNDEKTGNIFGTM